MIAGGNMTKAYIGTLLGGPNDGLNVEASVERIPVKVTTEMWLDGQYEGKIVNQEVITGAYIWNGAFFSWETHSEGWYKITKESD